MRLAPVRDNEQRCSHDAKAGKGGQTERRNGSYIPNQYGGAPGGRGREVLGKEERCKGGKKREREGKGKRTPKEEKDVRGGREARSSIDLRIP